MVDTAISTNGATGGPTHPTTTAQKIYKTHPTMDGQPIDPVAYNDDGVPMYLTDDRDALLAEEETANDLAHTDYEPNAATTPHDGDQPEVEKDAPDEVAEDDFDAYADEVINQVLTAATNRLREHIQARGYYPTGKKGTKKGHGGKSHGGKGDGGKSGGGKGSGGIGIAPRGPPNKKRDAQERPLLRLPAEGSCRWRP